MQRRSSLIVIGIVLYLYFIDSTTYVCDRNQTCGCSLSRTTVSARIIGGETASNNAWGWIVSLQVSNQHRCGASLLTDTYAITAAHCVDSLRENPSLLSIVVGTNDLFDSSIETSQQRTVEKIYVHSQYDPRRFTNDIALIRFASLSTTSDKQLSFICLPAYNENLVHDYDKLVAIGWGLTDSFTDYASNYLQQVTIEVIPSTARACRNVPITDDTLQFCAGLIAGGKGKYMIVIVRVNLTIARYYCRHMSR
jgi:secreted trypsin-like serine protease